MLRLLVLVVSAFALFGAHGVLGDSVGTVANKFIVTWSAFPDPFHQFSFFSMPRTVAEAEKDDFHQVAFREQERVNVYCRNHNGELDYRMCVLFDSHGSVAGIQISALASELDHIGAPGLKAFKIPELFRQEFLRRKVYSTIALFTSKEDLVKGGRPSLKSTDLTAPNGVWFLQTDDNGVETGYLHLTTEQKEAESVGFTEQACFGGMGLHYFQEMRKTGKCENHRPWFSMYNPKTSKLHGIGFDMYGKVSSGRGWFEKPPPMVIKMIAPNTPECLPDWAGKYGLFTHHVFFVDKPWKTSC